MVNVLIPMAGAGSRFVKQGIKSPKQLLTVRGKHVLDISLESMLGWQNDYGNLIFIVRDEQVYNFHIDKVLRQKYGNDIKIITTDGLTEGSVCSCLLAEEYINNEEIKTDSTFSQKDKNVLSLRIKAEIAGVLWGRNEAVGIRLTEDNQVQEGIKFFNEASFFIGRSF